MSTNLPTGVSLHDVERTAGKEEHGRHDDQAQTTTATRGFRSSSWHKFLRNKDAQVNNIPFKENPKWYQNFIVVGVEENGIQPVPIEGRTSTQYNQLFTVFFTCLLSLLPVPTGMLATLSFGLSLRDASLVIIFFALITVPPTCLHGDWRNGDRHEAVFIIPLLLNAATIIGFSLMSAIAGGQTLAALNPSHVSVNVGIVMSCLVAFGASLLGFNFVHFWQRWTWIPNLVALVIAVGCGGRYLHLQTQLAAPATPTQILNLGSLVAGYFLTFGGTVGDYSIYQNPNPNPFRTGPFSARARIFSYIYFGLFLPSVPLLILGAAIGGAVPQVPAWQAAYASTGIGGVMMEMLAPAAGFGKVVLVVLALSVIGNIAISMYSISLNLEMLVPGFVRVRCVRGLRFVFILVTMAVMIPLAVQAAKEWETTLANFLSIIGYWASCFNAVLTLELVVFRRMDYITFDHGIWNVGRKLPLGLAAIGASVLSWALVAAFVVTGLLYLPSRWLEIKIRGGL
ncbi:purine-cytosine permease [Pseudoneurospora amorphoporcata]|uniref:Purine-cytosine permease n=1 Tax=Pseudoneurospora amorphoporcata TaxID=241081 RepID=A0AAN6P157_9PEZI|nr:purine-cytosine permease [Pseudoneurospora amorphoporcata]